ncbi:MAG: aldehyde dehydrogenase family protein, partial [Candidatus Hydrogenedentes bacterium]|nr:aldehyde dehydrogenase family protein [Candidatus Hydrogenedentota bacterium]
CPWNFPFNVPGRKCTPALMAGNTCVLKPANLTPHTGILFTELFEEAGLPKGVLNCVTGSGNTVGETLVTDPRIKAITFTGSTGVGKGIAQKAARNLTRTQLEMGGKNPTVILEDADLDAAVDAVLKAAFACSGQWCTSTSRAIVASDIADVFTQRIVEKAKGLRLGPGTDSATQMGPVCGQAQLNTIMGYIEKGKREGATLLCGGNRLEEGDYAEGTYILPTVFGNVRPEMTIAQEEIFGPVLSVITVEDFDEAIAVANGVSFGLSSAIFTQDISAAMRFVEASEVGLTHVNTLSALKEPQLEFGGIKESGFGLPEAGRSGIEFFTEHKVAYIKY